MRLGVSIEPGLGTFSATGANSALTAFNGDTAYASITFTFNATDATGLTGTNLTETLLLYNGVTQRNILNGAGLGYANTLTNYFVVDSGNTYQVKTGNEWTGTVTTAGTGNAPPVNSTMVLDYQVFPVFNQFLNDYLVSVSITDTGASTGATLSREALSGITVTTPEPSTIVMFLGGISAIGLARFRRKRS